MADIATIARLAELDAALLVNKPTGIAAHDVMKSVKTRFNLVKVGHGGTLEANASGLFVVLLGDATRFGDTLMRRDRVHAFSVRFGIETDTCDDAGNVLSEHAAADLTRERVEAKLADFRGDIYQAPAAATAVKIPGKQNYEIIPTGADELGHEKMVHVYRLTLDSFDSAVARFTATATYGFSPRVFARDLGAALGCGARAEDVCRVKVGSFENSSALPLMDVMRLHPTDLAAHTLSMLKVRNA